MKIDLKRQLKAVGYRRQLVLRPIDTTQAQADALARLYVQIVRVWQEGARDRIIPAYSATLKSLSLADSGMIVDTVVDVTDAINATDDGALNYWAQFKVAAQGWISNLLQWHTKKLVSSLTYATNVDLSTQLFTNDPEVFETTEQVLARNVALIRNVSDQVRGRISDIVFRGLTNRTPVRDIAKQISEATGLGRKRAIRIASDQTVKLSAALDKQRQLQLGMDAFVWKHSDKLHYRPWHKERDGKTYRWSGKIAKTDPPGYAPFCGCKALGTFSADAVVEDG